MAKCRAIERVLLAGVAQRRCRRKVTGRRNFAARPRGDVVGSRTEQSWPQEPEAPAMIRSRWDERFGDRQQELV
jgi:hypothetical protein